MLWSLEKLDMVKKLGTNMGNKFNWKYTRSSFITKPPRCSGLYYIISAPQKCFSSFLGKVRVLMYSAEN